MEKCGFEERPYPESYNAFHEGLRMLEESLRNTEDSEAIIDGLLGTVKYFSQKHLCQNEVQRRKVRRGGCQAPLICPVAYSGGAVKGAASAAFIGVTGYGHADP